MIDPNRVEEVLRDCLFTDDEDTDNMVVVPGVVNDYGFNPERLEVHRAEIEGWLQELPDEFKQGWSMLNGCMDRNGEQWTGLQMRVGELFCLGVAIDKGTWMLPKSMWGALPGSMPYFKVLL